MKLTDIALAIAPEAKHKIIGVRPGEKLHEQMIGFEDAPYTYEFKDYYKILPSINDWNKDSRRINKGDLVEPNFIYSSDNNNEWMTIQSLQKWLNKN